MKAKTKFLKMYYKLPEEARNLLVLHYWEIRPYSLDVIASEIRANTTLGKRLLEELGFKNSDTKR